MFSKTKYQFIFITAIFLAFPFLVLADQVGEKNDFFVDSSYDALSRSQITATLQKNSPQLYFYVDDNWWEKFGKIKQNEIKLAFQSLAEEFENKIYPVLTANYGSEWKPGIDKDERITILFCPMEEETGGYFNNADQYPKLQISSSNQREMIYFNANYITNSLAKSFLAHEFVHLITFNQKEKKYGVQEEIWLNEARAEYAPTLVGYDQIYKGSNLEQRVKDFINNPSDPLAEWKGQEADYGALNLFFQYLVDHYGKEILIDSLHFSKIGVPSLNEALKKNGFEKDFSQVFVDWTIAVLANDCDLDKKYCYLNENLKDFKVSPSLNFLPFTVNTTLTIKDYVKDWAGYWYKFVGGKEGLELKFEAKDKTEFKIPYFLCDVAQQCILKTLELDENQEGVISIADFGTKYSSLTIIPSIQSKISGFSDSESNHPFTLTAYTIEKEKTIEALLAKIAVLKKQIAELQAKIDAILGKQSCQRFNENLYYGMRNDWRVECLQQFLKNQGPEIYPEGLVSGNFLSLTQAAVIRFQEKYHEEILKPLDLEKGTGYFGPSTRAKINQILGF